VEVHLDRGLRGELDRLGLFEHWHGASPGRR
jgi:hypothetical protein